MNRRDFVAMAPPTLGVCLGGCTSLIGPEETKIASISLMNLSEEPRSVEMRVERNGTREYRRTFDLAKKSEFGTEANPAPVVERPWMDEPARFRISARLAGTTEWYEKQFPVDDRRGSCYGVEIRVGPRGRVTIPNDSHAEGCS